MLDALVKWYLRISTTVFVVATTGWLWQHFPLGLMVLIVIVAIIARGEISEQRRRKRLGYWVEYLSPGIVRAADDDFAVVYHEGDKWHFFDGKEHKRPAPDILTVPTVTGWPMEVPEWMRDRRDEILARLHEELIRSRNARPIQIVEQDQKDASKETEPISEEISEGVWPRRRQDLPRPHIGTKTMPYIFIDMLRSMCSRPTMYVGEVSFQKVAIFLDGYDFGVYQYAPDDIKATSFHAFGLWLPDTHAKDGKYWEIDGREVEHNLDWSSKYQRMYPNDAEALAALPDLYQQFLDDPNRKPKRSAR